MNHKEWVHKTLEILFKEGLVERDSEGNVIPVHSSKNTIFFIGHPQVVAATRFAMEAYQAQNASMKRNPQ